MVCYANYLISIFMIINENNNERKIVEELRGIPTKLPIPYLIFVIGYQTWYQINAKS